MLTVRDFLWTKTRRTRVPSVTFDQFDAQQYLHMRNHNVMIQTTVINSITEPIIYNLLDLLFDMQSPSTTRAQQDEGPYPTHCGGGGGLVKDCMKRSIGRLTWIQYPDEKLLFEKFNCQKMAAASPASSSHESWVVLSETSEDGHAVVVNDAIHVIENHYGREGRVLDHLKHTISIKADEIRTLKARKAPLTVLLGHVQQLLDLSKRYKSLTGESLCCK